jgi:ABC-2 type transport system permease protein
MSINANRQYQILQVHGWKSGLGNLMEGEFSRWFRSPRWLMHLAMWLMLINTFMVVFIYAAGEATKVGEEGPPLLMLYGLFGGMLAAFGAIIIMQAVIVGEKRSGTASWVLSKPVTRTAFIVSRLVSNSIGILTTSVLVPGVLVYVSLGILSPLGWLPPSNFLAGMVVMLLSTFFWLTLTLMAGTFFQSVGGVIAAPIIVFFTAWFLPGVVPLFANFSPIVLILYDDKGIVASLINGENPFSWLPVISAAVLSSIFISVAICRFKQQDL